MKTEIVQAFVSVAELRSFSKASEKLYMSQPTISRYIAELERTMGSPLFVRNAHTCELTFLGKEVFVHAKRMMNEWGEIENLSSRSMKSEADTLRLGYTYQEMLGFITPVLSNKRFASSKLEIAMRFGGSTEMLRLLREGEVDCVVMHLPSVGSGEGLDIRLIHQCGMSVHVPKTHHFAGYDSVTMEALSHETDVRVINEKGFYKMVDEAFRNLNLPLMKHVFTQNVADYLPIACYRNLVYLRPSIYTPWRECKKVAIQDWTTDFSLVFVTRAEHYTEPVERLYDALHRSMHIQHKDDP